MKIAIGKHKKIALIFIALLYKTSKNTIERIETMSMRTDLALESANQISATSPVEGVVKTTSYYKDNEICVTEIAVSSPEAGQKLGKPQGRYVTIENTKGSFSLYSHVFNEQVNIISDELKKLMGKIPEKIMFVGLGNRAITPDSLGPSTAEKIFATRHLDTMSLQQFGLGKIKPVAAISPGVLGQTGIELFEIVKSVSASVKPDFPMVQLVGVVAQAVHAGDGVGHATNDNPHIAALFVGLPEHRVPFQGGRAVPCVHKQKAFQLLVCIVRGFAYFRRRLQMHVFHGVHVVCLVLVHIHTAAHLHRYRASQDFSRDRFQHYIHHPISGISGAVVTMRRLCCATICMMTER